MNLVKWTVIATLFSLSSIWAEQLSLTEAERLAVHKSYQSQGDSLDDRARVWEKRKVAAGYLPEVTYNANLIWMDSATQINQMGGAAVPGVSITDTTMLSHNITINQPITNGGVEIVAIQIAKLTKQMQEIGYEQNRAETVLRVRKKYFDIITLHEQMALTAADLEWAKQSRDDAKLRFQLGTLPETELLRWESSVVQREAQLASLQALKGFHYSGMNEEIGTTAIPDSLALDPFSLFETAYEQLLLSEGSVDENHQLRQMMLQESIISKGKSITVTQGLPKLNAFAKYSKSIYAGADNDGISGGWQAGLSLSVPLFNGMRNSTEYIQKRYEAEAFVVQKQQVRHMLESNRVRLYQYLKSTETLVVSLKRQVELNEKNRDILSDRYRLGQATQLDLLSMNQLVSASRLEYISTILDILYYHAEYENLIGTLEVTR